MKIFEVTSRTKKIINEITAEDLLAGLRDRLTSRNYDRTVSWIEDDYNNFATQEDVDRFLQDAAESHDNFFQMPYARAAREALFAVNVSAGRVEDTGEEPIVPLDTVTDDPEAANQAAADAAIDSRMNSDAAAPSETPAPASVGDLGNGFEQITTTVLGQEVTGVRDTRSNLVFVRNQDSDGNALVRSPAQYLQLGDNGQLRGTTPGPETMRALTQAGIGPEGNDEPSTGPDDGSRAGQEPNRPVTAPEPQGDPLGGEAPTGPGGDEPLPQTRTEPRTAAPQRQSGEFNADGTVAGPGQAARPGSMTRGATPTQANANRNTQAPSRLRIRQTIAPAVQRLLQLANESIVGYRAIVEGKSVLEALDPPQRQQLQQYLDQMRAAAQNDPEVNNEFGDLMARMERALGITQPQSGAGDEAAAQAAIAQRQAGTPAPGTGSLDAAQASAQRAPAASAASAAPAAPAAVSAAPAATQGRYSVRRENAGGRQMFAIIDGETRMPARLRSTNVYYNTQEEAQAVADRLNQNNVQTVPRVGEPGNEIPGQTSAAPQTSPRPQARPDQAAPSGSEDDAMAQPVAQNAASQAATANAQDFTLTGNLRRGSSGPEVEQLQRALGFQDAEVDGRFGPRTEQAVRTFQQNQGLQVDGIVGRQTYNKILQTREDPRAQRNAGVGRIGQVAAPTQQNQSIDMTGKEMAKLDEASLTVNGSASEIAELMRMMQLAGAPSAKPVDSDDISSHIHKPEPSPCGAKPEPSMGDMISMISKEEEEVDGDFQDATTEPDNYYQDVSASIPSGNDLNRPKDRKAIRTVDPALETTLKDSLLQAYEGKYKSDAQRKAIWASKSEKKK